MIIRIYNIFELFLGGEDFEFENIVNFFYLFIYLFILQFKMFLSFFFFSIELLTIISIASQNFSTEDDFKYNKK